MDLVVLPEKGVLSTIGQNVDTSHVVGIVHQRRYLHQHEGDQSDEQQGAGRAENARAEVSVGGTVYGGFPLSGRWFDWCGNERFSQNGQGVRI